MKRQDIRAIAASGTAATQASPGARSGLRHSVSIDYRRRLAVIDNPRLVSTVTHKAPRPFGHRQWLVIEGRR